MGNDDAGDVARISFPAGEIGTEWRLAGVDDFTGDAAPDLLWTNANGDAVIFALRGDASSGVEIVV